MEVGNGLVGNDIQIYPEKYTKWFIIIIDKYFETLKNEVTVSRKEHFNAAHRLNNDKWSITKNEEIFGKCNYPNYHGHNCELIVSVRGEINQDTG